MILKFKKSINLKNLKNPLQILKITKFQQIIVLLDPPQHLLSYSRVQAKPPLHHSNCHSVKITKNSLNKIPTFNKVNNMSVTLLVDFVIISSYQDVFISLQIVYSSTQDSTHPIYFSVTQNYKYLARIS